MIIEEKTKLFVCAVGVPPKEVVEKLHKAGILCMNVSLRVLVGAGARTVGLCSAECSLTVYIRYGRPTRA